MTHEDLERLLAASFDAEARAAVSDVTPPPAPRFAPPVPRRRRRLSRVLAPLAAAAAVAATVGIIVTVAHAPSGKQHPAAHASSAAPTPAPVPTAVHISLLNADGDEYGVGMPVIAYFSQSITDARALQRATRATVNGKPATAAWYFERSSAGNGPIEGHLRLATYWPAHAKIHVDIPAKGLSGGTGYAYDDNVTLDFRTGARNVAVVNDKTHELTLTRDGTTLWSVPVSLGAPRTPTASGTKVVMEKGAKVCMHGTGYAECGVKYTQRLTYGGEFLHSAPWNVADIREGVDSSNGCTNLLPADAKKLYATLRVGDVVQYPNAAGARMTLGAGYGDWNVDWAMWLTGGLVPTR